MGGNIRKIEKMKKGQGGEIVSGNAVDKNIRGGDYTARR